MQSQVGYIEYLVTYDELYASVYGFRTHLSHLSHRVC